MRYTIDEMTALRELFPAEEHWLMEDDYPVFWRGVYDWVPPLEDETPYDMSA